MFFSPVKTRAATRSSTRSENTEGVQAEIRKREGILRLLYGKRLTDPHKPAMRAREFTEMLACPLEHLEFAMWMLREQRLIIRSDNNHFEITWQGVLAFEAEQGDYAQEVFDRTTGSRTSAE